MREATSRTGGWPKPVKLILKAVQFIGFWVDIIFCLCYIDALHCYFSHFCFLYLWVFLLIFIFIPPTKYRFLLFREPSLLRVFWSFTLTFIFWNPIMAKDLESLLFLSFKDYVIPLRVLAPFYFKWKLWNSLDLSPRAIHMASLKLGKISANS